MDIASTVWHTCSWLRGATAVVLLIETITAVTEIQSYSILRLTHSIILGWNSIISAFAGFINQALPWLPDLSQSFLNNLLIFFTFVFPVVYATLHSVAANIHDKKYVASRIGVSIIVVPLFFLSLSQSFIDISELTDLSFSSVMDIVGFSALIYYSLRAIGQHYPFYITGFANIAFSVAALEILYWLNFPFINQKINTLSCTIYYLPEPC